MQNATTNTMSQKYINASNFKCLWGGKCPTPVPSLFLMFSFYKYKNNGFWVGPKMTEE